MKSVCAFTRKPDLSRADFQDYYEMHHAPLAVAHFPFRAYVRNHVLPGQRASFDTISEFWANDLTRLTAVREGPAGAIMAADEARFMDRARIAPARMVSTILSAGAQTDAQGVRWMLLLRWSGESVPSTLQSWAQALAARQPGVTLDVILAVSRRHIPGPGAALGA